MLSPILKHFKSAHNSYKLCFRRSDLLAFYIMRLGSKGILPPMIHGLLRISCSRNPKTPQIRSFFYEKWLLFGVLRVNKSCFIMQA